MNSPRVKVKVAASRLSTRFSTEIAGPAGRSPRNWRYVALVLGDCWAGVKTGRRRTISKAAAQTARREHRFKAKSFVNRRAGLKDTESWNTGLWSQCPISACHAPPDNAYLLRNQQQRAEGYFNQASRRRRWCVEG